MIEVFEWYSYACNNSSDHRLVAVFETPERAAAMAEELQALFELHAEQVQQADDDPDSKWDPWDLDPSPALRAFAEKYQGEFEEGLMWGDEGCSPDDLPEIETLGKTLLLYHGYMSGGFEGDLPEILEKAGASSVECISGPPWLAFTVEAEAENVDAVRQAVAGVLAQRETTDNLCDWRLPWGASLPIEKDFAKITFVERPRGLMFTLAMGADAIAPWRTWLQEQGATRVEVALANDDDLAELHREELAARQQIDAASNHPEAVELSGKSILFTGELVGMTLDEARSRAASLGATVATAVDERLDVVVVGDGASALYGQGPKTPEHAEAERLASGGRPLQIISESAFAKAKAK